MKSLFFILAQLGLVTIVYAFAYRAGYREAQARAVSVVKEFANPVNYLLDQLDQSVEKAPADQDPTADIEDSKSDEKKPADRS